MTGSATKQSISPLASLWRDGLLRRFRLRPGGSGGRAPRNERKTHLLIPAARFRVRVLQFDVPPGRRAQGAPGAGRTRRPCGLKGKCPQVDTGEPNTSGTPCAMALRLTSRSRRSTGLVSLRHRSIISIGLIPASGDHDHATSPYAPVSLACETNTSTAPRATCRGDRDTPSVESAGWEGM